MKKITSLVNKTLFVSESDGYLKKMSYLGVLSGAMVYNIIEARSELQADDVATGKIKASGDLVQVSLPIITYAIPVFKHDLSAQQDFLRSSLTSFFITHALKRGVNAPRPSGGKGSFPSGHASSAFQAVGFMHRQHGIKKALPAYLAASYVGWSRVHTKKHFSKDVLAGAMLGMLCAKI